MARGFTLIELLVVLAIVALLATLAMPRYSQYVERNREAVLAENLRLTRDALEQFQADRGRYPESLDELVSRRYLKSLPFDPIIESNRHWQVSEPLPPATGKVADIHSAAPGLARDGRRYGAW
ncbi:MAG: prepilin-type N-terminal cleavage/methylation domain-containing protein [Azonexus sp.]|nr:prepilin-type N-terminal cleavage/methylation domain-containing protein [Azonexus sp.]